ncbi:hypothetical protein K2Z84_05190 [Candidatus Binatia bacterium]|nr:hypothetical protein [Candidatus Binatia bacterium]
MTRNRIKYLRRVRASELLRDPANYRRHTTAQKSALAAVFEEFGFAGAAIARETPEGLLLIDGHLRADEAGDAEIPVLVLDVTEAEAKTLLAVLDPLADMAELDHDALSRLVEGMAFDSDAITKLLADLLGSTPGGAATPEKGEEEPFVLLRHRSRRKFPATQAEIHALWAALNWYVDTNTRPEGFVSWLLERARATGSLAAQASPPR